jgi:hypothetical protein
MEPLTPDDLLPLAEYAARRRELFESHVRYLNRYRRVRVGPRATLLFENRQTAWFRVQEVLRVARLSEADFVRRELDLANRLLPARNRLQAALVVEVADESRLVEELSPWRALRGDLLRLHVGPADYPANVLTSRPEDHCIGAAHWVQFVLDPAGRRLLSDPREPAVFAVTLPAYQHVSDRLSDEVRQSLLEDLAQSDRDAA